MAEGDQKKTGKIIEDVIFQEGEPVNGEAAPNLDEVIKATEAYFFAVGEEIEKYSKELKKDKYKFLQSMEKDVAEHYALLEDLKHSLQEKKDLVKALVLAQEVIPKELKLQGKDLNTTYELKDSEDDQKNFENKIGKYENMRTAMFEVFSILQRNEYPAGVIGSNAFVLLAGEATAKVQDDLDINAGIPDLTRNFAAFKEMQEQELIRGLNLRELTNLDGENDKSFEISFNFVGEGGEEVPVSIFYTNVNYGEDNGLTSFGKKEHGMHKYILRDDSGKEVEVCFADLEATKQLYAINLLTEIRIFDLKRYGMNQARSPWVTPKALQRFSNLYILCDQDFDEIFETLDNAIVQMPQYHDRFTESKDYLKAVWDQYLKRSEEIRQESGGDLEDTGYGRLTEYLCREFNNGELPEKGVVEKAVNIMTGEIKKDSRDVYTRENKILEVFNDPKLSHEEKRLAIGSLGIIINELTVKYRKYYDLVDHQTDGDFMLFAGTYSIYQKFTNNASYRMVGLNYRLELQELIESNTENWEKVATRGNNNEIQSSINFIDNLLNIYKPIYIDMQKIDRDLYDEDHLLLEHSEANEISTLYDLRNQLEEKLSGKK